MLRRFRTLAGEVLLVGILSVCLVSFLLANLPACLGPGCEPLPWYSRFFGYLVGLFSPWTLASGPGSSALLEVMEASAISVSIIGLTTMVLLGISIPLGVSSALRPESRTLSLLRSVVFFVSAIPVLVWAVILLMIMIFGYHVSASPNSYTETGQLAKMALPVLALALGDGLLADFTRRIRLDTDRLLREPHMRTVQAWGLGVGRHLTLGLIPPVMEFLVSRSAFLVGTSIVVETVFDWPGLGSQVIRELANRDGESERLVLLISVALVGIAVSIRLMRSVLTTAADPRGIEEDDL